MKSTLHRISHSQFPHHPLFLVPEPPDEFSIQGSYQALELFNRLPRAGLAIVGTREPETRTLQLVHQVVLDLAQTDIVIVSGFARWVDTMAHQAALRAGLPTVAVLGCGIDISYPPENEELKNQILQQGGILLTEMALGERPQPHTFLKRNRLIAALAKASWIAQAPKPSGAINTAAWARKLDRDLYVTPHFPNYSPFAGNQQLFEECCVYPLNWAHSFGTTWLELNAKFVKKSELGKSKSKLRASRPNEIPSDIGALFEQASQSGIPARESFNALQQELWDGRIRFENGRLYRT